MYTQNKPKHQQIYDNLLEEITRGVFPPGAQLPTERELVERYQVSRPTVAKALTRLQQEGFISRRAGSGSFVSLLSRMDTEKNSKARYFGLLIPKLGVTEIFEPICGRIAQLSRLHDFHLLWGDSSAHGTETIASDFEEVCLRYIDQGVDGLFFVPLELVPSREETNARIVQHLEQSRIPVVMLDSDYLPFPRRSPFDLVGIDNTRAGYMAALHYLDQGARRIDFLYREKSAYTVDERLQGVRLALAERGISMPDRWVHIGEPQEDSFTQTLIESGARNMICANDATAIALMHTAYRMKLEIPRDLRIIGFDNVKYSEYARIPLTTLRQPCASLGELAVETMLLRLQNPRRAPTKICAEPEFLIRDSSIIPSA
ncbi:DNA-binding transcriptional regulator, LacI/PurR family [Alkalispirochaeta americana]|uniref:DNA-binding transcriptional regulator, LacI/PurR family n=1 Tax=Alkalispirochaeta americana TaxID=159291 RepID=A0A1N6U3A8_9SPIO|nr:GntR family transcriptional regulator [Alkalispirochaeta americana]SIQ59991.1 DNA-binding transcriptional regulator, LacI/PurR family [Alkalispirochaeta americana]